MPSWANALPHLPKLPGRIDSAAEIISPNIE
jgi:hypothetical protein